MNNTTKKNLNSQQKKVSAFSDFFRRATPSQQDKVIKKAIREANNDQRKLMDEAVNLATQAQ
jgi:hypothetical protein